MTDGPIEGKTKPVVLGGIERGMHGLYIFRVKCRTKDEIKRVKDIFRIRLMEKEIKVRVETGWCEKNE